MQPRSPHPLRSIETDVAILGGGLAGLTAAVGLADAGVDVVVLERDSILGGRARSWTDEKTGDPVHIGPHILLSEYPNMIKLMKLLGTEDKIKWADTFVHIVEGQTEIIGKDWDLPAPLHFLPSLFADAKLSHFDRLSAVPVFLFMLQLSEDDVMLLDNYDAETVLRKLGVTQRYLDRFWNPTCMYIMNATLDQCTAGGLLRFFRYIIGRSGYRMGFPAVGLGDLFAPGAQERIEARGGKVMTNATVVKIHGEHQISSFELADGTHVYAKQYILALPPMALLKLLPEKWIKRHETLADLYVFQGCPYVSVYLWFDKKVTKLPFWARLYKPTDFNSDFYDLSNINIGHGDRPSLITSNMIHSDRLEDMSDEEIVAETYREICEYLPEARDAKVVHHVVNRIPMAVHKPLPGTEQRRPDNRSPIANMTFAGDWTNTKLPACMESATCSGWLAAEAVLESFGRRASLAVEVSEVSGFAAAAYKVFNSIGIKRGVRWLTELRKKQRQQKQAQAQQAV